MRRPRDETRVGRAPSQQTKRRVLVANIDFDCFQLQAIQSIQGALQTRAFRCRVSGASYHILDASTDLTSLRTYSIGKERIVKGNVYSFLSSFNTLSNIPSSRRQSARNESILRQTQSRVTALRSRPRARRPPHLKSQGRRGPPPPSGDDHKRQAPQLP
jgi:hypothetical protein